jgi:pyrroline-5-carboxylate reductase
MKIGFIGTGTITAAVVRGLIIDESHIASIVVSPRSDIIARRLAELDPRVSIATSNQDVLDRTDLVCLAVRPQIANEVLEQLKFRPSHKVISFIATFGQQAVENLVKPAQSVIRAVPLPAVEQCMGATAICPPDATARDLFSLLGKAVEVEDSAAFNALLAVTATMGSFFALLDTQATWLTEHNVGSDISREFLSRFYLGLANASTLGATPLSEMTREFMTAGGINEQFHGDLAALGLYRGYATALDHVLNRIQGGASAPNVEA